MKDGIKSNIKGWLVPALATVLACIVVASLVLDGFLLAQNKKLMDMVNQLSAIGNDPGDDEDFSDEDWEGPTREDGVTIAEEYVVESTLEISDAYLSGNWDSLDPRQSETLDMASQVLSQIITPGMTPYQQEEAVYLWMTENITLDEGMLTVIPTASQDADDPYGTLKHHSAVCVGYATTFRLFMQMLQIPCMVVHSDDLWHTWNLVELDGHWYHTDVYSDAGASTYANFNCSDEMFSQSQTWDTDFFPAADSLVHNVLYQQAQAVADVYALPALLRQALDGGSESVSWRLDAGTEESDLSLAMSMLRQLQEALTCQGTDLTFSVTDSGEDYLVTAWLYSFEDGEFSGSFTQEQQDKAQQAIDAAFGDMGIQFDPNYIDMEYAYYEE